MKKLLLINPVDYSFENMAENLSRKFPPMALGIIAALTPDDWEIDLIDENFDEFAFRYADLVGVTAFTCNIYRAYQIATIYKKHNIHTVIGGIHATVMPDEAGKYFDTVVVGEAENVWPKLISDFINGYIRKIYHYEFHSMVNLPKPRRDIFDKRYMQTVIQTSRGCPYNCEFCTVPFLSGKSTRFRPVNEVLDELQEIKQKSVLITDDNLFGIGDAYTSRGFKIFEGIIQRKIDIKWNAFASVNCTDNLDLIKLAAKSGLTTLFIGFEAEDEKALILSGKKNNLRSAKTNYKKVINTLHQNGISILAGILYGFDTDDKQSLAKRTSFVMNSSLDSYHVTTLTPFPGTQLYSRLKKEGRLIYDDLPEYWKKYNFKELVFTPKNFSREYFDLFMRKTHKKLYSKYSIYIRFIRTLLSTKSLRMAKRSFRANISLSSSYFPKKN